ncbi:hypothetical protein ACKKBG_A02425 [Auxenochlorella protothecoides x Auxenochlorella symbiontica]
MVCDGFKSPTWLDTHPEGMPNLKKGTLFTAAIHIFCGIIGAGVLALPRSPGWLGWVAGPTLIFVFYLIALLSSWLLDDCYQVEGVENGRYHDIVKHIMGIKSAYGVSVFQTLNIVLIDIAYAITASEAMGTLANTACGWQGIESADCFNTSWALTVIFGAVQVVSSLVPNLESAWWVSAIGTLTSIFYASVALVLGMIHASNGLGTIGGIPSNPVNKAFEILNALGAIGFAYSFSSILVEIQDTLAQPPKAAKTMGKATTFAVTASFAFYFLVAIGGYSSLGNDVPSYILGGLEGPDWVIFVANFCVLLHMWSAYQIYAQPMFDTLESHIKAFKLRQARAKGDAELPAKVERLQRLSMAARQGPAAGAKAASASPPTCPPPAPPAANPLRRLSRVSAMAGEKLQRLSQRGHRLITRGIYVVLTTLIAAIMPFFGAMAGLVGALAFFPLTVFFPFRCWRTVYMPSGWFNTMLYVIEFGMALVCIAATIASFRNIIVSWSTFKIFQGAGTL